jgi:DNA-binding transcriptional regulator GbsR (MarR family)
MTNRDRDRILALIDSHKRASELAIKLYEESKDLSEELCYMTKEAKDRFIEGNNELIASLEKKLNNTPCSEEQEEQGAKLVQRIAIGQR